MTLADALVFIPVLIVALTLHEFAHAWTASLLGDDFARRQGRVSFWPGRHLSLLGTLAFFVLRFGWGKPVPVNLYNFKRPKRDYLLSSLAGPGANLLTIGVCFVLMLLTRWTYHFGPTGAVWMGLAHMMLRLLAVVSAILAVINILPVPPLDGSKIWPCLIPGLKPTLKPRTTWLFLGLLVFMLYTGNLAPIFHAAVKTITAVMPVSEGKRVDYLAKQARAAIAQAEKLLDDGHDAHAADVRARAEVLLSEGLAINPHDGEMRYLRAATRSNLGRHEEALGDIERAIEIRRDDPIYYQWRAHILDALDRPDEARRDRETARALYRVAAQDDAPVPRPPSRPATAPGRSSGRSGRGEEEHAENP